MITNRQTTSTENKDIFWGDDYIQLEIVHIKSGIIMGNILNLSDDHLQLQLSLQCPNQISIIPESRQISLIPGEKTEFLFLYQSSQNQIGIVSALFFSQDYKFRIETAPIEILRNDHISEIVIQSILPNLKKETAIIEGNLATVLTDIFYQSQTPFLYIDPIWITLRPFVLIKSGPAKAVEIYGENQKSIKEFLVKMRNPNLAPSSAQNYIQLGLNIAKLNDFLLIDWENMTDVQKVALDIRRLLQILHFPSLNISNIITIIQKNPRLADLTADQRNEISRNLQDLEASLL